SAPQFFAENFAAPRRKFHFACATRARSAPYVSFRALDFRSTRAVIGWPERDRCTCGSHRRSANAASRRSKRHSARFPDNLCPASTRDYELIRNQDARNSRFRIVGSRHLPASPSSFRKIQHLHLRPAEIRHERGAGKIPCPLRRSGNKWKYVPVGAQLFSPG